MADVAAEWVVFVVQANHLPVQSEHLLDEGAAVVKQGHVEAEQVFRFGERAGALLGQKLAWSTPPTPTPK